jgi:N-glycosylase/DNA lyase
MRLNVPFDLDFSLCCGQVFRWQKQNGWWYGIVGDKVVKIRQRGCELEYENVSKDFVLHYFGLNDDLVGISECIARDDVIKTALRKYEGLRIVRQLPWECLISFICATYKSIAAIEQMLKKISAKYGNKIFFDDMVFNTFPLAEALSNASENGLLECGLGYRAKYIKITAKKILDEKIDLDALKWKPYLEAREKLLEFPGVGLKVADCVCLFSLEKMNAFPVDVWIKRVILNHYSEKFPEEMVKKMQSHKSLTNGDYQKIGDFARKYFGAYAGYAQEYLFHYERTQC